MLATPAPLAEMARDLAPDVEKLMEQGNPYVRKKAALCAIRSVKRAGQFRSNHSNTRHHMHHTSKTCTSYICHLHFIFFAAPVSSVSCLRIVKKVPELVEVFADRAAELLNDRNQAVVLTGVALMLQVNN